MNLSTRKFFTIYLPAVLSVVLLVGILFLWLVRHPASGSYPVSAVQERVQYSNLPANQWVKIHMNDNKGSRRQSHAGIAYDSRRGVLLVFGSNAHGGNWDNSVHEFNPDTREWETHYSAAPRHSYRTDMEGRAVSGVDRLLPWAMHTYDGLMYDPIRDALIVISGPDHNPEKKKHPGAIHPTWLYDLTTREWQVLDDSAERSGRYFNAASAYDGRRNVPLAYKWGIWELGVDSSRWKKASDQNHHSGHHNMVYDSRHDIFAVFGSSKFTSDVWVYSNNDSDSGGPTWRKMTPSGDVCPLDQHLPAAFDTHNGVFLLVADNNTFLRKKNGRLGKPVAETSSTYIYDYQRNKYTFLPQADMPALGMNYMMVYAEQQKVFLLVTGNNREPTTVWALRLDPTGVNND